MPKNELRERYGDFFSLIESYFSERSVEMITDALILANSLMADTKRYDGTPMLDHGVRTAMIVISEIGLGRNSTISTLMHDPARMGLISEQEIGVKYGKECIGILRGMNNISDVNTNQSTDQADNFRELIVSYSTDPRIILIKLADRLEVMRSLSMFPPQKRAKKSWESLNLYAQIAHKLGLYSIKSELEDVALKYLEPTEYSLITAKLAESASERQLFIENFVEPFKKRLEEMGIKFHVKSRTKSVFSIWSKMRRMGILFEEVYDIFAIRIVIDCPAEQEKTACWSVYSVATDFYTPNPERMRDWISIPKSNGYESLHTTVVTKEGKWVEIQIRTERMDMVAERGIAAHWRYKGVHQGGMGSEEWLSRLREMMEGDNKTLARRFNTKMSSGEIFVFTPNGDLRKLVEGATVLDFAFDIHTNLGAICTGAKVNQRNVSIREVLHNGDIVEVLTSKNQRPKADWLNIVVTGKARNKIKAYMREEAAKVASLGREELERKLKNWKFGLTVDDTVGVLTKYYKVKTGTELYANIAGGSIAISEIKDVLTRYLEGEFDEPKIPLPSSKAKASKQVSSDDPLIVDENISGLDYKFARCCNPIFGDDIFGFITVAAGVTIHRADCPNAARLKDRYPYRVLDAKWKDESVQGAFRVAIRVQAEDTTGMVNKITDVITRELKLNIRSMNMSSAAGSLSGLISLEVTSSAAADTAVYTILRIKGVQKAYRVSN